MPYPTGEGKPEMCHPGGPKRRAVSRRWRVSLSGDTAKRLAPARPDVLSFRFRVLMTLPQAGKVTASLRAPRPICSVLKRPPRRLTSSFVK